MTATTGTVGLTDAPVPAPDAQTRRLTIGVSGLYLSLYLHYGFFALIPLWLKATGASPGEIGVLLAIPLVLRLLTVAPFTAWAGRRGRVRDAITVTTLLSAAIILLLLGKPDHAGRIAVVLAFSIAWDQIPVLVDAYAVMSVRSHGVDFGRVRVWGSIAVVASSASAGWVLQGTGIEALPFPGAGFAAVISQYGIEYTDLERSLPEAVRMVAPGGRLRFVIHAADGVVARDARMVIADADLLLEEIDLPGHATRCFEAVLAVERGGGDTALADTHFAAFQTALERTARHVPQAADRTMFKNSGGVLLDTFQRRGHFDLEQMLAKAEQIRSEITAHRGRLQALVDAARSAKQADAMADRLNALGGVAARRPLEGPQGLIAHVVAARFP